MWRTSARETANSTLLKHPAGPAVLLALVYCVVAIIYQRPARADMPASWSPHSITTLPSPAHVVVVMEENHAYSEIIGNAQAPYINSLAAQGALFTNSYALTHPSQPNYLDLFSGSNQGVTDDSCPHTFTGVPNLGGELISASLTFTGYSEGLPGPGSGACVSGAYARKHAPWVNFTDDPPASNLPFTYFPTDFTTLPTLSFVIPNLNHDMHDGTIAQGDTWLQQNLDAFRQWAMTNNSLLVVTWDEDDGSQGNRIPTIFVGPMLLTGQYSESVNHFVVLRTFEDMYGLPYAGQSAQVQPITDVWVGGSTATPTPAATGSPTATHTPTRSATVTTTTTGTPVASNTTTRTPTGSPTTTPTTMVMSTATGTPTLVPSATNVPAGPTSTLTAITQTLTPTGTVASTSTATPMATAPARGTSTASPTACSLSFSDVPVGSTFYPFIHCLACLGIINGYPDDSFRPGNQVTRGQLSKIVSNAAGLSPESAKDPPASQLFEDVPPGSAFYDYVLRLARRGIVAGYPCGGPGEPCGPANLPYFRPGNNATRGQISKIVSNAAGFNDPPGSQLFEDVPPGSAFYDFAQRLANRGVIGGYPCGGPGDPCGPAPLPYFRPGSNATRGQVAKIVRSTFFPNCSG